MSLLLTCYIEAAIADTHSVQKGLKSGLRELSKQRIDCAAYRISSNVAPGAIFFGTDFFGKK